MRHLTNFLGATIIVFTSLWVLVDCSYVQPAISGPRLLEHMPPPDFAPTGVVPPISVQYMPKTALPEACHLTPERLMGCSILYRGVKCIILIGEDESPELQQAVLQHERAHCEGWHHAD